MTLKVYSVRSNARRDARRFGVDPDSVVAEGGGFVIGALRSAPAGKQAQLQAMLEAGWQPLHRLCVDFGWQSHTIRGVISRIGKGPGLKVERRRDADGLSYRVVRS